jgi:hypothetical protein
LLDICAIAQLTADLLQNRSWKSADIHGLFWNCGVAFPSTRTMANV